MAREPFLINPPKRRRVKKGLRRRAKRLHGNSWFGAIKRHSAAAKKGARKRVVRRRKHKNPFGEEVLIVGANPRRRKRHRNISRKRTHSRRRRNLVLANPVRRHRRARRHNPIRRRRHHARRHHNPIEMSLKNPMSIIMPVAAGIAAKWATDKIPAMIGMNSGYTRIAVQAGIAVGGGMLLRKFVGKDAASAFALVAGVNAAVGLLNTLIPGVFSDYSNFGAIGANPFAAARSIPRASVGYNSPVAFSAFPYESAVGSY